MATDDVVEGIDECRVGREQRPCLRAGPRRHSASAGSPARIQAEAMRRMALSTEGSAAATWPRPSIQYPTQRR